MKGDRIKGNPKRKAPHLIKGIVFQLWHSVYAWITLGDHDSLFLEGAEDIDVVSGKGGTTLQLRATAQSISLGTGKILEALENYWEIVGLNSGKEVFYRYISTSEISQEAGADFGGDRCGLAVWNGCVVDSPDVSALRRFLAANIDRKSVLGKYLATSTDKDVFERLISRVKWDYGADDASQIEQITRQLLVVHGEKYGVVPSDARMAADTLLVRVAEVARDPKSRQLNRADFLEAFENATMIVVPRQALSVQFGVSAAAPQRVGAGLSSFVETGPPPNHGIYGERPELEGEIVTELSSHEVVVIHGATGSGKTSSATAHTFTRHPLSTRDESDDD